MVAEAFKVSRKKQDEYALISHSRANEASLYPGGCRSPLAYLFPWLQAVASGVFADEIIRIELNGKVISVDDTIRPGVTLDSLASLKPVFPDWGDSSTTAGNASGVGDGAALCILTTRERAEREGMDIVGKWVASTVIGQCVFFRKTFPNNLF